MVENLIHHRLSNTPLHLVGIRSVMEDGSLFTTIHTDSGFSLFSRSPYQLRLALYNFANSASYFPINSASSASFRRIYGV